MSAISSAAQVPIAVANTVVSSKNQKKQLEMSQEQLDLQKAQWRLQKETQKFDLQNQLTGINTDIRETTEQIGEYDRWLGNYNDMYAQQVQSKQAQTDSLMASGKETYDNFLNAIGYSDAMAGATGRVGAGTSAAHTTGMFDRKLVDYVGADRTLDASGGLFGSQLTAANMEMQQLKTDLNLQKIQVGTYRRIADESLLGFRQAQNDIQQFIDRNFA